MESKRMQESAHGAAFEPGEMVEHPLYGVGHVLSKSTQKIDNAVCWVNEIRFDDGKTRMVVACWTTRYAN